MSHNETIRDFNIVIEIDNITTIKELVASNLGVTIMAHSAVAEEESSGRLKVVPVENFNMPRQINLVYRPEFNHAEIFEEIRGIYNRGRSRKSAEET